MARFGAAILALTVGLAWPVAAAAAAEEPATADDAVAAAVRWLSGQQQDDGGFDAFLPGGATPDAILALAESAQTEPGWAVRPALERVDQEVSGDDRTPIDALRRIARRVEDPLVTARLIVRVALPLGFDVDGDGPFGDLTRAAQQALADEDTAFPARVEVAIALLALGEELPEGTLEAVAAAQQANGGWNAEGSPDGDVTDLATTGAVVDLLVLSGADPATGAVPAALALVAESRARNGAWAGADGERSPVATAGAIRAIRAVGHDPADTCWQVANGVPADARTPVQALVGLQEDDGSYVGPDPVRVTSEAVHALSGRRLPVGRADEACASTQSSGLPFEPSLLVLGAIAVIGVGGGLRIMRGAPSSI